MARVGGKEQGTQIFVRGTCSKRPLTRPRHRGEDNIKMDIKEIGRDDVEWMNIAQEKVKWQAFVNTVMNFWV